MHGLIGSAVLACGALHAATAAAHEFWIEVQGDSAAIIRVGQMLAGNNLPYLDRTIRAARHFGPRGDELLTGRQGDLPALTVDLTAPGLHLLTVETQPAYAVFDDLPAFRDYLAYEGLQAVEAWHRNRGLPTVEIAEEYFRHARTLVQIGPSGPDDRDTPAGLRYELVATTSPFAAQQVELQLLWEGLPQPSVQIAQFHKGPTDQDATRRLLRSDADGRVIADIAAPGTYLFSAVHMLPAVGPGSVTWQSHWASLSFVLAGEAQSQ